MSQATARPSPWSEAFARGFCPATTQASYPCSVRMTRGACSRYFPGTRSIQFFESISRCESPETYGWLSSMVGLPHIFF